jgi:hypothetical protein
MNKSLFLIIPLLFLFNSVYADSNQIIPVDIVSSSYLGQNDFLVKANYHPYYIIDDDPNTTWVEGANGDGIGEKVVLNYLNQIKVDALSIYMRNGYQKNKELFQQNNRLKEIKVNFINEINSYSVSSFNFTLEDCLGYQEITINRPITFNKIEIIIVSVYKGSLYQDTCLSDLRVEGNDFKTDLLKKQENIKFEYIKWFEERDKQALFFKNLPKDYSFNQYKKIAYEKNVQNNIEHKWTSFISMFKEADLFRQLPNSYFVELERILSTKIESENDVVIKYFGPNIYEPSILNNINVNLANFLWLSNFKISKAPRLLNSSYSYKLANLKTKAKKLTSIFDYNERSEINYYYYDNSGKLFYVDIDKNYEEGEFFNGACLIWQQNKIIKIIHLFAIEGSNESHLYLSVYDKI